MCCKQLVNSLCVLFFLQTSLACPSWWDICCWCRRRADPAVMQSCHGIRGFCCVLQPTRTVRRLTAASVTYAHFRWTVAWCRVVSWRTDTSARSFPLKHRQLSAFPSRWKTWKTTSCLVGTTTMRNCVMNTEWANFLIVCFCVSVFND